ncbi:hypothetical protein RAC89_08735 [Paenibacillus sp. GD4]|jgi:hypothetical protein|uniref:hypothetical protein n=1 Tax=Paenibacillus sp. GD4 TaxID=3068890 RepID=UPI0027964786|nr:hypothetical protein [Paenibacillus sp. GD4]MDQ1910585.1 hypothetical protein [Paenibacillus sp. GD4]
MRTWHYIVPVITVMCLWAAFLRADDQAERTLPLTSQPVALASSAPKPASETVKVRTPLQVGRVCGIAIQDDLKTVYEMKGEPVQIETSPENKRERVLIYEDCRIGLLDQFVRYVTVPAAARQIEINSSLVNMRLDELRELLGDPYHVGEDGLVYRYGQTALKLTLDETGEQLEAVDFFHVAAG